MIQILSIVDLDCLYINNNNFYAKLNEYQSITQIPKIIFCYITFIIKYTISIKCTKIALKKTKIIKFCKDGDCIINLNKETKIRIKLYKKEEMNKNTPFSLNQNYITKNTGKKIIFI